jgi:hypothetical protein
VNLANTLEVALAGDKPVVGFENDYVPCGISANIDRCREAAGGPGGLCDEYLPADDKVEALIEQFRAAHRIS